MRQSKAKGAKLVVAGVMFIGRAVSGCRPSNLRVCRRHLPSAYCLSMSNCWRRSSHFLSSSHRCHWQAAICAFSAKHSERSFVIWKAPRCCLTVGLMALPVNAVKAAGVRWSATFTHFFWPRTKVLHSAHGTLPMLCALHRTLRPDEV